MVGLVVAVPLAAGRVQHGTQSYGAEPRGHQARAERHLQALLGDDHHRHHRRGAVMLLILWTVFRYRKRSGDAHSSSTRTSRSRSSTRWSRSSSWPSCSFHRAHREQRGRHPSPRHARLRGPSSGQPVVDVTGHRLPMGWRFDYPGLNVGVAGEPPTGPTTTVRRWSSRSGETSRSPWSPTTHPRVLPPRLQLQPLRPARA